MIKEWMLNLLFPNRCCLCGDVITMQEHLCGNCAQTAPYVLPPVCQLCGRSEDDCSCEKKKRNYERCVSAFRYEGVVRHAIGTLKNRGDAATGEGLAVEMAELIRREYGGISFDCIAPVPLHRTKRSRRGFNQAALLANALSQRTGIPFAQLLIKIHETREQKTLNLQERDANLLGAFDVLPDCDIKGRNILLVDDLLTTGATLNECAKMLKIYGAEAVFAITAAAAILNRGSDGDEQPIGRNGKENEE